MYNRYDGRPVPEFKAIEVPEDEFMVEAYVSSSDKNYVEIKTRLNNRTHGLQECPKDSPLDTLLTLLK